ncbi:MAG: Crp/Fnr family transcriptional regulator [Chitinophagales bacterium]|nr:Crp/Fnr family transcriptional regulator [Chitinophagales bacterium]
MNKELLKDRFGFLFEEKLINEISESGKHKRLEEGQMIMDIGQKMSYMPLVVSGSIKILSEDEDGNDLLLYYLEMGDTCAMTMSCCLGDSKSTIKAITEEPTELIQIPIQKMEEWVIKYKSWRTFVFESYNTRLNEMLEAIDNLAFNNMEERLFKYLKDKAMVSGSKKLKITHYQIANDLHSSRVVISRLMKKLDQNGKISHHRNLVEVKDLF